jgi:hypothetical protein
LIARVVSVEAGLGYNDSEIGENESIDIQSPPVPEITDSVELFEEPQLFDVVTYISPHPSIGHVKNEALSAEALISEMHPDDPQLAVEISAPGVSILTEYELLMGAKKGEERLKIGGAGGPIQTSLDTVAVAPDGVVIVKVITPTPL